jgi:large subunit ribosomal protein L21
MFAIIRTGGKQYRVQPGDHLKVEKLEGHKVGSEVEISEVLFIGGEQPQFGSPLLSGAKVGVVVTQQDKHGKILVFKKKRRKGYRRMKGHRQPFTEIFVKFIAPPGGKKVSADSEPRIIDTEAITERKAKHAESLKVSALKKDKSAASEGATKPAAKKAKTAKASKKAPKKKVASKRGAKIAKKKAAKKTAKKKE